MIEHIKNSNYQGAHGFLWFLLHLRHGILTSMLQISVNLSKNRYIVFLKSYFYTNFYLNWIFALYIGAYRKDSYRKENQ